MKKIVLVLVAAMVLVFTGCEKKETICAGGHWAEPGAVHEGFHEAGVKAARI